MDTALKVQPVFDWLVKYTTNNAAFVEPDEDGYWFVSVTEDLHFSYSSKYAHLSIDTVTVSGYSGYDIHVYATQHPSPRNPDCFICFVHHDNENPRVPHTFTTYAQLCEFLVAELPAPQCLHCHKEEFK